MFLGLVILVLGIIFLLRNLGIITYQFWEIFWPSLLILLGLSFILKRYRKKHWWDHLCGPEMGNKIKAKIEKKLEEK